MDTEDCQTSAKVRRSYNHAAVKTARTQERRIKDIRTVRSGDRDDAFIGTETIHFDEQLVQRLFAFIMSATQSASALTADGIDSSMNTIHGAFFLAWAKRSRTRDAPTPTNISTKSEPEMEKNGTRASPATALARRVLPVPGGPTRRTPFGILARYRITSRIFRNDDFGKFFLRFVLTCDIIKVDMDLAFACHLRSGLAKAHDASAAALCLVHDPEPYDDKDDDRKK